VGAEDARALMTTARVRRLLISDATSYKAAVLAAFAKRHYPELHVTTCDSRPVSAWLHTRFSDEHVVLRSGTDEPARYADELAELVRARAIELFVPVASSEMELLVARKHAFGGALSYLGSDAAFASLHRKDRLVALALQCGVRVPETFFDPARIRVPAVAKPVSGSAARGVAYLRTSAQVDSFLKSPRRGHYLVQEYVAGEGVGYSVFARDGRVLRGYGHRRLAEYPVSGGSSVYRESYADPRLAERCQTLVGASGWSGFAMFEFKLTPERELYLLEANPRPWGSLNQGLQNGVNYLEPLLGPPDVPLPTGRDVRTYLSPLVYLALASCAVRGRFAPLRAFLRNTGTHRADIPVGSDPRAFLALFARASS
jgi:biotin carboxylase